jgi:hypothetical protein
MRIAMEPSTTGWKKITQRASCGVVTERMALRLGVRLPDINSEWLDIVHVQYSR